MDRLGINKDSRFRLVGVTLLTAFIFSALVLSSVFASGQNRPRTAQTVPPRPNSTANAAGGTQAKPTPTPRPNPATPEPTLGEAPPIPRLKPTPTPTPPEEIEEGDRLKFNTDLVSLHVRVI